MAGKGSKKILKYQLFALVFQALLLENGVTAHEIGVRDGRHSGKYLAALAHIAYDSGLGGYGGIVGYFYMSDYSDLTRYYAVLAYYGRACDTGHGRHHRIVPYLDVVGNLAEVVYLHSVAYYGGLHFGAVHGGAGPDFDIVPYDDVAKVLYLLPCAVGLGSIAEAVGADDAVGMEYDPVADNHPGIDADARINYAVLSYNRAVAYGDVVINDGVVADFDPLAYGTEVAEPHPLAELRAEMPFGAPSAVALVDVGGGGDILEQLGHGGVGVVHPHHGGGNGLLGLEILVDKYYRCLRSIDVMLVFGVGIEGKLAGFAVLYLGKACDGCIWISVNRSSENAGKLFCSKLHLLFANGKY